MFWKVLGHVFVPSSGLDENNIKGAFYPGALLVPLYIYIYTVGEKIIWSPADFVRLPIDKEMISL